MKTILSYLFALLFLILCVSCQAQKQKTSNEIIKVNLVAPKGKAIAAFAEGCFWCSEHIFEAVVGVDSAVSGYAGGTTNFPTYELVNTETTGHAETVLVYYDPKIISYAELTKVFFTSHDPTTLDRQGPDRGNSYRSILFYRTPDEEAAANKVMKEFSASGVFKKDIVSEIKKLEVFFRAEGYHQNYIEHHPESGYVQGVSIPRFILFKQTYKGKLK